MKHNRRIRYSKKMKMTAILLLFVFACQLLYPTAAMALTTGPSQPEVQGFEPVGTTDMVDMFSGSFVYNIPLLDVEGYPVNISYHGGVSMEQEASWVGLGWNINPGTINRTVRGLPDDFNGDSLLRDFSIKDEKTLRAGVGVAGELAGVGDPFLDIDLSLGGNVNISNYRGVSCDFDLGAGINVMGVASAGANVGIGSQTGASIGYTESGLLLMAPQLISKDMAWGIGLNPSIGGGYNTRTGVEDLDLSFGASIGSGTNMTVGFSSSDIIPIGVKNYVPVITNSSTMSSINGRIKLGVELLGGYPYFNVNAMFSRLHYNNDGSRLAYGYMYLQNASIDNSSVLDFTRDKDGMFNKSMQYLPPPNMTYDIYNVSGQGTGGIFRPFRNDFGNVYDPYTTCSSTSNGGEAELGLGDLFEAGLDYKHSGTEITSGPWGTYQRSGTPSRGFTGRSSGSLYENVYFKQAGELTEVDSAYYAAIGNMTPITPDAVMHLPQTKPGSTTRRDPRANLIYYHTAQEDTVSGVGTNPNIVSYAANLFEGAAAGSAPTPQNINRIGTGNFQRKKNQISEIVQVQKDGRKYVYGIPAMNNVQREVTFSVDPTSASNHVNYNDGMVSFSATDASKNNPEGRDNYYNSTVTPSYAHSYLLTSVLSADYVDVTGNGLSDDDLGSFTKFNYSRTDSDYRWVAPYSSSIDSGQYNPGFWSDPLDDQASFVSGSREQWNLHSIETKNFIAEFYTSQRNDAQGVTSALLNTPNASIYGGAKTSGSYSYELDSIKLYNKHDRFINGVNAVPIKTVFFVYSYSLCPGVPNSTSGGKLTLQRIFFRYGNSDKSMISPYQFGYGSNPNYSLANKDRWGDYKPSNNSFTNYEFPYVNQNDPSNNTYAAAWSLTQITLPSGGVINANYECNDYAFVQNQPVNEMFMVQGLGNSPSFSAGTQLYKDNNTPYLYAYFMRRPGGELPKLSFEQNYLGMNFKADSQNCVYFNFNVGLTSSNKTFEQIKGYANVTNIGKCTNDTAYGYIQFIPVTPTDGGGNLNPVTYTALNVGRYNLPQIIFPGSDPNETDLHAMLAGLKESFGELMNIGKSPIVYMVKSGDGQNVNLTKSYIRLQSVGLSKKGGGQRVSSLTFNDQWSALAGGIENNATYGKNYNYTINDSTYGTISSGVASYEPLIGGDENPLRQPVPYIGQSAHNSWPPNDPVDLYQETPIGESLFPPAQVGYSQITVTSIHSNAGRSSQGVDQYQFYTARDFPAQVIATSIKTNSTNHYDFFSQQNLLTATQGYSLIFNDMHGKPKKVEHDVYNTTSQALQPISYQMYYYRQSGNKLNNKVRCMVYNGTNMQVQNQLIGIDEDVTMDSRQKNEDTHNSTINANLNSFLVGILPCPLTLSFSWGNENQNEFQSAAVTKVVQQYGVLDNVVSYNEGAVTTMKNEIYDPNTGQAVVTSTTNEFMDKEYSTNIPAYWVYNGMSPSCNNILYKDTGSITIGAHHIGTLHIINTSPLVAGDQLLVSYVTGGARQSTIAWVMGILPVYTSSTSVAYTCTGLNVLPRFPLNTPGWDSGSTLTGVNIQVINSGHTNRLSENVEAYTSLDSPMNSSGILNTSLSNIINLKAKTFADSNTVILRDYLAHADTVNPFAIGERGVWRLYSEYSYLTTRNYAGVAARNSGLYGATSLFAPPSGLPSSCYLSPFNYLAPYYSDPNWHVSRTITKWSPYGKEVENIDAVGNYSSAVYGFNEELPVAVASNSRQGEVLSDGFEDYDLLQPTNNIMNYLYSPFNAFTLMGLSYPSPLYNQLNISNDVFPYYSFTFPRYGYVVSNFAHTGANSLYVAECNPHPTYCGPYFHMLIPLNNYDYNGLVNNYNIYFPNSTYHGYSFSAANEYLPFEIDTAKQYIFSCWVSSGLSGMTGKDSTDFYLQDSCGINVNGTSFYKMVKTSNIIDGWMQVQVTFKSGSAYNQLILPGQFYIDDVRIFPANANMKSFVYNPYSEKLMATLDENNFATFYEYDQEGNLVRVKKETTKGIMTTSESRSGNPK